MGLPADGAPVQATSCSAPICSAPFSTPFPVGHGPVAPVPFPPPAVGPAALAPAVTDHDTAGEVARRLGFAPGQAVLEIGWDEDADEQLRVAVEQRTGAALLDPDRMTSEHHDVVDAVLLWWRDSDGDLVDTLVDALTDLTDGGFVWLLTPKVGHSGYVEPGEIGEAAPTAGLSATTSVSAAARWSATKLVAPRTRARR